jgi:hypothetical protein
MPNQKKHLTKKQKKAMEDKKIDDIAKNMKGDMYVCMNDPSITELYSQYLKDEDDCMVIVNEELDDYTSCNTLEEFEERLVNVARTKIGFWIWGMKSRKIYTRPRLLRNEYSFNETFKSNFMNMAKASTFIKKMLLSIDAVCLLLLKSDKMDENKGKSPFNFPSLFMEKDENDGLFYIQFDNYICETILEMDTHFQDVAKKLVAVK